MSSALVADQASNANNLLAAPSESASPTKRKSNRTRKKSTSQARQSQNVSAIVGSNGNEADNNLLG